MNRFRIAPQAQQDLEQIWNYLGVEKNAPEAAHRQIEMLYGKFDLLSVNTLLGERRNDLGDEIRAFAADNYVVVYRTQGTELQIVRVLHAARDITSLLRRAT